MRIPFPTWSALVGALSTLLRAVDDSGSNHDAAEPRSELLPGARWLAVVLIALFGAARPAAGAPLEPKDVPTELKPWMGWALRGHETEACTQFRAGDTNARE